LVNVKNILDIQNKTGGNTRYKILGVNW